MTASAKVSLWERGLQPSARVGRFTVKQPLGQSALVSSYLVEHSTLGFPALLKVATTAEAIASEANALALLHSPHVPLLYAQGELEDDNCIGSYFVCEFIEGTSLHHILREQRRLNVSLVLRLALQVLWALEDAHRQGLVHGDVRPENVFLAESAHGFERFVLCEFGGSRASLPPRSGVMAKVTAPQKYAAPEVRAGMSPSVGTDLFSLGCVLFEVLSGQHPEWDASGRLVKQLAEIVPTHPDLSRVITKAISIEPKVRFETAQDFATVLLALDVDEVAAFSVAEGTIVKGPAETVDTVDMTQPRVDLPAPGLFRHHVATLHRPELLSTRKPQVWVLTGDPGLDRPQIEIAIGQLRERYEVFVLDSEEREQRQGAISDVDLPWVVVFGDLHTLVEEPVLQDLRHRGETARLLVSTHENVDMLSTSVNATGLDAQVWAGERPDALVTAVDELVECVRATRIQYDGLRLAVADAQADIEQLQHTFERKSA